MNTTRLIGGIFLAVGLVIATVGAYCYITTQDLVTHGLRAQAVVVEMRLSGKRTYAPVVEFDTAERSRVRAVGKISSSPPAHKVSDVVTVIYRAGAPEDVTLDEPFELWFLTALFGGLGAVFAIIGGGMLISSMRSAKTG